MAGKNVIVISMTDRKAAAIWAADCADHVLPFFTAAKPVDDRPRLAIEAARAWARGEIKTGQARSAALASHAAARECTDAAACAAARAAGHAAATAHMDGHAVHAVAYAVKAARAASASEAEAKERAWQCARLDAGKDLEKAFCIREATEEDYPSIVRLSIEWEQEGITYGYVADSLENVRRFRCWCILGSEGVAGYLIGEKTPSFGISVVPEGSEYFKVWDLYITPNYRSRGLGSRLMDHVERMVKSEGIGYILLSSSTKDAAKIQKFYTQKAGFAIWDTTFFKKT